MPHDARRLPGACHRFSAGGGGVLRTAAAGLAGPGGIVEGITRLRRVQSMSLGTPCMMVSVPRSMRVFHELP